MAKVLLVPSEGIDPVDVLSDTTRLRCEYALANHHNYDYLITSGGMFLPATHQMNPAGVLMRDWLIEQGVPAEKVFTEWWSVDTYENIEYCLKVLEAELGDTPQQITVATQWRHARRFLITFKRVHGIDVGVLEVPVGKELPLLTVLYEHLLVLYTHLDPAGTWPLAKYNKRKRTADGER